MTDGLFQFAKTLCTGHEALITKQDFDLVQRIRGLDTRTSPKQDTVYLFSGVLICGCCGSRMTRKTNRVNGKEYHYYYCHTGKKHGCANPVMLKESKCSFRICYQSHMNALAVWKLPAHGI